MLTLIRKFFYWLTLPFFLKEESALADAPDTSRPRNFRSITEVEKTPPNQTILADQFIIVTHRQKPLWAIFKCPCGCGDVISLAMQPPHNPRWRLVSAQSSSPTLHPSIWRSKGCFSHFFVRNGYVDWCNNTGQKPWLARPDLYKAPIK